MAFNLSKNNDPVPAPVPDKKSNVWIVLLLVGVIVGGAIWYFIPKKEGVPGPVADTVAVANTPVIDTAAVVTAPDTAVAAPVITTPRVAASFGKGTSSPVAVADEVVNEIKKAHKITIYGYASSEGDIAVNTKLAQERAEAFKQYLISKGVDANIIMAIGKGIDNPIATNDTETGRTQNRRVEVSIE